MFQYTDVDVQNRKIALVMQVVALLALASYGITRVPGPRH